jgi:hypothetical protein
MGWMQAPRANSAGLSPTMDAGTTSGLRETMGTSLAPMTLQVVRDRFEKKKRERTGELLPEMRSGGRSAALWEKTLQKRCFNSSGL